jgi:hypothetical protein
MKMLMVVFILFWLITAQATEIKEQVGPYAISLSSTALNTTAKNGTISDEDYRLSINYTIPDLKFGQIDIVPYNDTLNRLAMDYALIGIKLGYEPQEIRHEKIDGRDGVVVPYNSPTTSTSPVLNPPVLYQFGYWLDEKTLVKGWFDWEPYGPCWEEPEQDLEGYLEQMKNCANKSLDQTPIAIKTLHVTKCIVP